MMYRFDIHSQKEVAEAIGIKNSYMSDVLNGRYPLSENVSELFRDNFGINPDFLLEGKGAIWIDGSVTQLGDNNISGDNNQVGNPSILDKAIDEIAAQRKLVAKAQEQIDRLIGLLEKIK